MSYIVTWVTKVTPNLARRTPGVTHVTWQLI